MRCTLRTLAAQLGGKILEGLLNAGMGVSPFEQLKQVLAKGGVFLHGAGSWLLGAFGFDGKIPDGWQKMLGIWCGSRRNCFPVDLFRDNAAKVGQWASCGVFLIDRIKPVAPRPGSYA